MPLIFDQAVTADMPAPNSNGEPYIVSQWTAAYCVCSGFADAASYTLRHYALIDDENNSVDPPTSRFPDATDWPEMGTMARTETGDLQIIVPLDGVNRWAPRITFTTPGGGETVKLQIRRL